MLRVFRPTGFQDQVPSAPQGPASPAQAPLHHQEAADILLKCAFAVLFIGKYKNKKKSQLVHLSDLFLGFFGGGGGLLILYVLSY